MKRIPDNFFKAAHVEVRHSPDTFVARLIRDAIDRAPSKLAFDAKNALDRTKNYNYRKNGSSHDRRIPTGAEVKSAGYKIYKRPDVTWFFKGEFEARLFLDNGCDSSGITRGSVYTCWNDDSNDDSWSKHTSIVGAWLVQICLYHFSERISGVSVNLTNEAEW